MSVLINRLHFAIFCTPGFSICFAVLLLSVPFCAEGQIWNEIGEAHPLPLGQLTIGSGSLLQIDGQIQNPDNDADIYCIKITDPATFSAMTVGSAIGDLSLWLFDSNFNGVTHDGADFCSKRSPRGLRGGQVVRSARNTHASSRIVHAHRNRRNA